MTRKKNNKKGKESKKKKFVFQLKPKLSHSFMCSRYTAE